MEEKKAKEAEKRAKLKTKEAKKAKPTKEKPKKAEKAKPAKVEAKKATESAEGVGLYRGMVVLNIASPVGFAQLDILKQALFKVEDLRVVMVSGAVGEGSRVFISAEEPLPLINILRGIPVVEEVTGKGDQIEVRLKAG